MKNKFSIAFKTLFFAVLSIAFINANAQVKDPLSWTYTSKKKADGNYDLIITATLPKPWHIYAQNSGVDGPVPTTITFNKNPLITLQGKPTETGEAVKKYDKDFKTDVIYYNDKVVFTQIAKVKGKVKTTVTGSIEYMICDDKKCLPPKTINFLIKL